MQTYHRRWRNRGYSWYRKYDPLVVLSHTLCSAFWNSPQELHFATRRLPEQKTEKNLIGTMFAVRRIFGDRSKVVKCTRVEKNVTLIFDLSKLDSSYCAYLEGLHSRSPASTSRLNSVFWGSLTSVISLLDPVWESSLKIVGCDLRFLCLRPSGEAPWKHAPDAYILVAGRLSFTRALLILSISCSSTTESWTSLLKRAGILWVVLSIQRLKFFLRTVSQFTWLRALSLFLHQKHAAD